MRVLFTIILFLSTSFTDSESELIAQSISAETYEIEREKLGYHKTKRELVPRHKRSNNESSDDYTSPSNPGAPILSGIFKIVAFGLVALLIGFILYIIFSSIKIEKKIEPIPDFEEIENIEEIDAVSYYARAIENGDYRLALRMQFIKALQLLSKKEIILWKNDKTNRDYIREIETRQVRNDFRQISLIYEKIWYGNLTVDLTTFRELEPYFTNFLNAHN